MEALELNLQFDKIPEGFSWLDGEGAGSWFYIEHKRKSINVFHIMRCNEKGVEEFDLEFSLMNGTLDLNKAFQFTYPSHAKKCTIIQDGKQFKLKRRDV